MDKKILLLLAFIFVLNPVQKTLIAQTNDDCLSCHSDSELSMERKGKTISLFVDQNILQNSVHKKLSCVSCHKGFNPEEIPHKEVIEPIKCSSCHKDAPTKHIFHPQMLKNGEKSGVPGLDCKSCHGTHNVVSTKSKISKFYISNLTNACGDCHKQIKNDIELSIHYKSLLEGCKIAPNCLSCHKTKVSNSYVKQDSLKGKIAQEKLCLSCHIENPEVSELVATRVSLSELMKEVFMVKHY